jgi:hypothetical protein
MLYTVPFILTNPKLALMLAVDMIVSPFRRK